MESNVEESSSNRKELQAKEVKICNFNEFSYILFYLL